MQCSLIQELMLYKFELGHNTVEAIKSIGYMKGESVVDHFSNQMVQEILLELKEP